MMELERRYRVDEKIANLSHTERMVHAASRFRSHIEERAAELEPIFEKLQRKGSTSLKLKDRSTTTPIGCRIGIHNGPLASGVLGRTKWAYDVFGDTVNTASRLSTTAELNKIQICEGSTVDMICSILSREGNSLCGCHLVERGTIELKGKGHVNTFYIEQRPT